MPTPRTPAELYTEIAAQLASAQPGGITAQQLRTVVNDVVASSTGSYINASWYGAVGDGTTDDTAALQSAIDAAVALCKSLYIPGTADAYKITAPLVVAADSLVIFGDGPDSYINNLGVGDALQLGDDVTLFRDVTISQIKIGGDGASGWGINARKMYNPRIDNCIIAAESTVYGGIYLSEAICANITRNVFNGIAGTGLILTNASNAATIIGNRFDGQSNAGGTGMSLAGRHIAALGNVIETFLKGIVLEGGAAFKLSNYFENVIHPITDTSAVIGFEISESEFQVPASSDFSINLRYAIAGRIAGNHFDGVHTSGAPIQLLTGNGLRDIVVGPNYYTDADEVSLGPRFGQSNIEVLSENKFFRPVNYLRNSLSFWPGGVNAAPATWEKVGTVAQRSDAAFGKYGCDLVGSASGLERLVVPTISAIINAHLRRRYVVFSVWARRILGTDPAVFQMLLEDGSASSAINFTITDSWARYDIGIQVSSGATKLSAFMQAISASTVCVSGPALYVGTTAPRGSEVDELDFAPLMIDAVQVDSHATANTVLKTVTIPGRIMGAGGGVRIRAVGECAGTANTKTITIVFGGTVIATIAQVAGATDPWTIEVYVRNKTPTTQVASVVSFQGATIEGNAVTLGAVNTAADVVVELKGQLGNAADTNTIYLFEVIPDNGP